MNVKCTALAADFAKRAQGSQRDPRGILAKLEVNCKASAADLSRGNQGSQVIPQGRTTMVKAKVDFEGF